MPAISVCQHFQNIGTFARAAPRGSLFTGGHDGAHIHAVDLVTGDVERQSAARQVDLGRRPRDRRAHRVPIILDYVDYGELPKLRHVEAFVDLALIGGTIAEIGDADIAVAAIAVRESETRAQRHLRANNPMPAVETLLHAEHVHGAAFAFGIAVRAPGEFGHDPLGVHAGCDHVTMVAIAGNDLVAGLEHHLHADDDGFLADIEVAEPPDKAHAVHLPCLLFEAADGQHSAVGGELLLLAEIGDGLGVGAGTLLGDRH